MKKHRTKADKFTVTEVGTLIEAMRSEFKPYLEIIPGMQEKLNATYEQVGKNTEDIQIIKSILKEHSKVLNEHDATLKDHSAILKEHSAILKEHSAILKEHSNLLNRILEELKSKVDRKDFEILEKKVATIS